MTLRDDEVEAVLDTLRSGWLTMGPRIKAFEAAFAEWVGVPHAVAVSSGTAALHLACLAAGIGPGDRVLVPAFGSRAAVQVPGLCGAEAVFCDVVSPAVPVLDVVDVERRLAGGAHAVIALHTWGHAADVDLLREVCATEGAALIEDCREAIGAMVGAHGRQAGTTGFAGAFSLGDGRQLAVGEGGVVTTTDPDAAARVRLLRSHAMTSGTWDRHRGHADTYDVVDVGFNFRLDEPRAALATSRLVHLREDLEARRRTALAWRAALEGVDGVTPCFGREDDASSAHGAFGVLFDDATARDRALDALTAAGIRARALPAYADLPRAAEAARRTIALALDPAVDGAAIARALGGAAGRRAGKT
jgi:dTDP-4-amino-4,6-dideoxygalactose transaminase